MTSIQLTTKIKAPIAKVFDLSRSIDIHMETMEYTQERAIAGRTTGLIELHETVTWEGSHFGIRIQHESIISKMDKPHLFIDEQKTGHFKWLKHIHKFEESNGFTYMIDDFSYQTPFGVFGKIFDTLFLKKHLINILEKRSSKIKNLAES